MLTAATTVLAAGLTLEHAGVTAVYDRCRKRFQVETHAEIEYFPDARAAARRFLVLTGLTAVSA